MNDSKIGKEFENQMQSAQSFDEKIEKNKQDVGVDGSPPIENKSNTEYESYIPTLEMKGNDAQKVRQVIFEEKQAKLWMDHHHQEALPKKEEKPFDQEFKQKSAKPLKASFFDSLSDEDKAKIEAYKQANPKPGEEQKSHKKGQRIN